MKILRILPTSDPSTGGVIESVLQMSKEIEGFGHSVEIVCLDNSDSDWIIKSPIRINALGPSRLNYRYCPRLKEWLFNNHQRFDQFIIDGLWQYHSVAAASVLRKCNRKYFVFPHGMLDPWFKKAYPLKHLKKMLYWPFSDYKVLRDAKAVLFTTDDEKILARQSFSLYKCEEKVIPIGTKGFVGDRESSIEKFYEKFPHLKDKKFFLFLGRIHPKKGIDILLESFCALRDSLNDTCLVIAGPGPAEFINSLSKIPQKYGMSNRVYWAGMLSGDIKWGAFHSSDVFILPSHQENFGMVVAESLSCNKPVLISNKINIWREIAEYGAGFVGEDNVDGCIGTLKRWEKLTSEEKSEMGKNAGYCFKQNFEINVAVNKFLKFIE